MRRVPSIGLAFLAWTIACARPGPAAPEPRPSITLTWLAVAGWTLSDGQQTLVFDPYFSRVADPTHARPDEAAIRTRAPARADLVLVGHDHWDHALDAPLVAQLTGAPLLGGLGLVRKLRDQGFPPDRLIGVRGGEDLELGGFSVRVVPSLHSFTGLKHGGDVDTLGFLVRLGGRKILVLDTANYIEREVEGLRPDVAIIATGFRQKVHGYTCRLLEALGFPAKVLPTHFDDLSKPAGTPLELEDQADLDGFVGKVRACSPRTEVTVPRAFVPVAL